MVKIAKAEVSAGLHKKLKQYCLDNDISMNEFIETLIAKELRVNKHGKDL